MPTASRRASCCCWVKAVPLTLIEDAFLQSHLWVHEDFRCILEFPCTVLDEVRRFAAEHHSDWATMAFCGPAKDWADWTADSVSKAMPAGTHGSGVNLLATSDTRYR